MPRHIPPPRLYWLLLAALPLLLLLGGCESTVETRTEPASQIDPRLSRAEGLEAAGDNLAAAELFLQLAGESQGARQGRLRLRAAENYLRAGDPDRAEAEIRRIDATGQPQLAFARRLLEAELATTRHHPDQALALLQAPPPADSDRSTRIRYHRLRAEAFRLAGDLLGRGRELEALDSLLQDPDARLANQLAIIQTYTILSDQALQRLTPSPPGEHGGWMALARIIKNHGNDRARARPLIDAWRQRFPAHPALPALLDGAYQKLKGQYRRPSRIAILLPEEGRYARVARALRDGFLAAYYQEPVEQRPQLLFYDSSDPDRIWPLYQEAVAAGADLVVGPLDKQGVAQLARAGELE
ncbi:MAG TPA: penicillin-binding protein activator, partial [Sedimenticola sp.]|nr:penicillin-binding protein activator [Sedimenticola sp.]